jgi:restriction system protein
MSRRNTLFDDVMRLPWPVGLVLALLAFIGQQIALSMEIQSPVGHAFKTPVRVLGYFLIAMFLLASFVSFFNQVIRARRFDKTKSLTDIRNLTWRQFESFTAEAYKRQGYTVIETPEGPDNGIDLVLRKDGEKTYVQCKHWKANSVGVEKIRELLGSMTAGGAHNGIFVTSGQYTNPARDFARECGIRLVLNKNENRQRLHNLFPFRSRHVREVTLCELDGSKIPPGSHFANP